MRTLVACNILTNIQNQPYMNHINMIYRMAKHFPDMEVMTFFPYRQAIDVARNMAAQIALENDCDYLFFYDDDSCPHPDTFKSLYEADKDIIMAHTYIRGVPFHPMCFKEVARAGNDSLFTFYDDFKEHLDKDGLVECAAVGFSTVLIKVDLIRKMTPPYFVTGSGMTEDVYFCIKSKKKFPQTTIYMDPKVPAGHMLNPEAVSEETVERLRKFYEVEMSEKQLADHAAEDILNWLEQVGVKNG